MKRKIKIKGQGNITLKDSDYLSSGGEADVYVKADVAYKIYHKPEKMISSEKFQELSPLSGMGNIIVPQNMIYDEHNSPIGFSMSFKPNTEPLCKLFTNSYKKKNNVSAEDINCLIDRLQSTIQFIHEKKILVVDLNELNLLVPEKRDDVYFIDVDSYQTQSHRATAIMTSIRDPLISNNHWNDGSDWFSFAILAFQMWIGIHPYKGRHPNYKPKDWVQRMSDGISVFDKASILPRVCNDFGVMPPSHYQWLKAVFTQDERSKPPTLGEISQIVISSFNIVQASENFEISKYYQAPCDIKDYCEIIDVKYVTGDNVIYKETTKLSLNLDGAKKVLTASSTGATPVIASVHPNNELKFTSVQGKVIGQMFASDIMSRNKSIYSVSDGSLYEHSFEIRNGRDVHSFRLVCNVMTNSAKMFDGVLFQSMLKKQHAVIPYEKGACAIIAIPELDNSRIVGAKCERNICVVLCEQKGVYNRHVLTFDSRFQTYTDRVTEDVPYSEVNFTVLPTGVTILATDDEVEIFKGGGVKVIDNPPFNASTKLFNKQGTVYYIEGDEVFKATIKK